MTGGKSIVRPLLVVYVAWISMVITTDLPAVAACQGTSCRILVVGDMGIGDDAFAAGFLAVQQAMVQEAPDLVLFMGDYIYTREQSFEADALTCTAQLLSITGAMRGMQVGPCWAR